jgi:hypothetical protein
MTYYIKFGKSFFGQRSLSALIVLFSSMFFFSKNKHDYFYYITAGTYLLLLSIIISRLVKLLYFFLRKKPVLIVNELYIFDCYDDEKFYWIDILEVVVETNSVLMIELNKPDKYLKKSKKLFSRFLKPRSRYYIPLHLNLNEADAKEFTEKLNDYSIAAENQNIDSSLDSSPLIHGL